MFLTISLYASLASALVNPGFIILFQIPCWSLNSIAHAPHVPGTPSGQSLDRLPSHSTPFTMTLPYLSPSDRLPLHCLKYLLNLTAIIHRSFLKQFLPVNQLLKLFEFVDNNRAFIITISLRFIC